MDDSASRPAEPGSTLAGAEVLVTGASGFLGRHLVSRLLAEGARVHAVSRRSRGEVAGAEGASWHAADLADADAVAALVAAVRPRVVFHLASHVAGSRDLELVLPTFHANLASTVHLLTAVARQGGCRSFVQAGSLEESRGDVPASPYAAAKLAASAYAEMFAALYAVPAVVARIFMVYGPGQPDLRKLVPYVATSLLRGAAPRLSSGTRPVDWIYVDDVVEGLLRLGRRSDLGGRHVDLGSGELVTVAEVVSRLFQIVGQDRAPDFGSLEDRPREQVRSADVAATAALLGWRPATDLDAGLAATVEWYRRELAAGRLDVPVAASPVAAGGRR